MLEGMFLNAAITPTAIILSTRFVHNVKSARARKIQTLSQNITV